VKNVGNGYLQGIELEQRFELGKLVHDGLQGFRLSLNETLIDSKVKDNAGVTRPFKEQPPYLLNAILDWRNDSSGTSASIAFRYVPSLGAKYSGGSGDSRGAERFVDLRLGQQIVEGWEVFFLGTNVTDQGRAKRKTDNSVEVEATGASYLVGIAARF
jgi:outer membrane receptor protein involved in Fe transport